MDTENTNQSFYEATHLLKPTLKTIEDPFKKIWGFHIHQELPDEAFPKALVIQEQCIKYLISKDIQFDDAEAFKPGYGPHLNPMWELRIENSPERALENLGLALSYMAINRSGLSAYIHPLMHNRHLQEDLANEGRVNQSNTLWFGYRVQQNQDFFFNPPRNKNQELIDTRTPRIMSASEKALLLKTGKEQLQEKEFKNPEQQILNGFHIHMDYSSDQAEVALYVFDEFLKFLINIKLRPTSTRLYCALENGPHIQGGWEVKFELSGNQILRQIGIAVGWLMCNRQGLSVFLHPVTWKPGDVREEYRAHSEYCMFIGSLPDLDLNFFLNQSNPQ